MQRHIEKKQQEEWDKEFVIPEQEFMDFLAASIPKRGAAMVARRLHISRSCLCRYMAHPPDPLTRRAVVQAIHKLKPYLASE